MIPQRNTTCNYHVERVVHNYNSEYRETSKLKGVQQKNK